jgi:galactose mutarotase-like enzyme
VYPFDFELQLTYTLHKNKIVLTYTVINNDVVSIPFSLGAHPAFALPKSFENYALQFEKSEHLVSYQLDNDLLSNKTIEIQTNNGKLPLSYSLFEKDALIFKKLNSKKISILENTIPTRWVKLDYLNFNIIYWSVKDKFIDKLD